MLLKTKETVYNRALGLCEYCKSPANISSQPFVIEHIIAKSRGGSSMLSNLALACQGCNNHKYNKLIGFDVISKLEVDLFHPRFDIWSEHFCWSDDTSQIIGITATGRVTVEELRLNRIELLNLRQLLFGAGKHPPLH
jgi:hypothetical protein